MKSILHCLLIIFTFPVSAVERKWLTQLKYVDEVVQRQILFSNINLTKEYELSLEIKAIEEREAWTHLLTLGGSDMVWKDYGERNPLLSIPPKSSRLHISSSINGEWNYHVERKIGYYWTKVNVSQIMDFPSGDYLYAIAINDTCTHLVVNSQPISIENARLKVFDSGPRAKIRNIFIKTTRELLSMLITESCKIIIYLLHLI